jgi:hypothetical protein
VRRRWRTPLVLLGIILAGLAALALLGLFNR